jgi:hypothetical protein
LQVLAVLNQSRITLPKRLNALAGVVLAQRTHSHFLPSRAFADLAFWRTPTSVPATALEFDKVLQELPEDWEGILDLRDVSIEVIKALLLKGIP